VPRGAVWNRVLTPLMRSWVASVERGSTMPFRPMDAPRAHTPGHDSDRILIFGAGPAVGWGVTTHALALPGAVARALSAQTGRGADVDLTAEPGMLLSQAPYLLRNLNLSRYDAVIIVLGVNDALALTPLAQWRAEAAAFLDALRVSLPADTKIVVAGIPPIRSISIFDSPLGAVAGRHADALNRATAELCSESSQATFVPLGVEPRSQLEDERHRSPREYTGWARQLTASLVPLLASQYHPHDRRLVHNRPEIEAEAARQDAVARLQLRNEGSHARIMRILAVARQAFHVEVAAVSMVGGDSQTYLAQVGSDVESTPRRDSFCDVAIRGVGPLVVRDASEDSRFSDGSMVGGGPRIRFYAGFPVELPSGERVGTLCVIDREARPHGDVDEVLLRELALLVQREFWA
jgi:lysophospholipase L1-like esterase